MAHLLANLAQTGVLYMLTVAVVTLVAVLVPTSQKRADAPGGTCTLLLWRQGRSKLSRIRARGPSSPRHTSVAARGSECSRLR